MTAAASTSLKITASKGRVTKPHVVLSVIALVTCMQLSFHFLVGSALQQEADECASGAATPYCAEAAIFRQWQAADAADIAEGRLEELLAPEEPEVLGKTVTSMAPDEMIEVLRAVSQVSLEVLTTTTAVPAADSLDAATPQGSSSAAGSVSTIDVVGEQTNSSMATTTDMWAAYEDPSSWDNMTEWARDLVALQGRLEDRMKNLKSARRQLGRERLESVEEGMAKAHALGSEDIEDAESASGDHHLTAWARDLAALQERLQKQADASKTKRHRRTASTSEAPASSSTVAGASTTNLLDQILDFGRTLCLDPRRRSRPSCAEFLVGATESGSETEEKAGGSPWDADAPGREPAPGDTTESTISLDTDVVTPSAYERVHDLHWSEVAAWQKNGTAALRGARSGFESASKVRLQHLKWAGMMPKVACVAVVPSSRDAHYQLKNFINGFRRQSYEGPKELVLVYHHEDLAMKSLLKQHTDGVLIKAVATMGTEQQHSTLAYRFGAWKADADIVARYDLGAWHHPSRLAMQVRALGLARRPASRLRTWTARNYAEGGYSMEPPRAQVDALGEASLVGERQWMQKHWYPLYAREAILLKTSNSEHVVEVDMPELLVYNAQP